MRSATLIGLCLSAWWVQAQNSDAALRELTWNPYYSLQWSDFQGEPNRSSLSDAGTAVRITAQPFLVGKRVEYDVKAIFDRNKSWARDTSQSLLSHEQLHFDIAELYARKIRKRVGELQSKGIRDIGVYNKEIQLLLEESNDFDRRYDIETLHGSMAKKQAVWESRVQDELARLRAFKEVKRVIGASPKP